MDAVVLTTDFELMGKAGVNAVKSIDWERGVDGNLDCARDVTVGFASPAGELSQCCGEQSESASEQFCSEAICAAARFFAGLR